MKKITLLLTFCCLWLGLKAQSPTYINETFNINAGVSVAWYGDVTFGPKAVVYIEDGAKATFYGQNMTVNAGAKFIALPGNNQIGTGNIVFKSSNPMYSNYPLQQTLNGGFGTSATDPTFINLEIDNPDGLKLTGNLRIANQFKLTNGHVYLNNANLVLGSQATIIGAAINKHLVTNGTGVLTKEALATNASFHFPISIDDTEYTPAIVTNKASDRNISVQIKNYTASTANETTLANRGIDRTWQISSNLAGVANISLQHNAATNTYGAGTNQSLFNNTLAYVTQQQTAGVWFQNCSGTDGATPTSVNQGDFTLSASVNDMAYFTKTSVTCVNLAVTKTVNSVIPKVGNEPTFTIEAKNIGVIDATGVKVTDLLPSGYTLVSSTPSTGTTYNASTGVWTIGNLANNATATLQVKAKINASGDYKNVATITGDQQDPDVNNNKAEVTLTPDALQANLAIDKSVDIQTPIKGNNVVFTIDVVNNGPDNATNVKVTDVLKTGYTYVSSNPSTGTYNNSTGVWAIGNLANGATAKLTITAKVNATGDYTNTATITGDELDPVMGNNSDSVTPNPDAPLVNLSIDKTVTQALGVAIGDEFDYTIVVKNIGTQLATGVVATDILPANLAYVANNTNYGTVNYNSGNKTLSWNIGDLATSATITLTLKVKAIAPGITTNTAIVSSTQPDSDSNNNTSSAVKDILDITFPNVITPNGDGKNDTFKVLGLNAFSESSMSIYNRWNNEVWHSVNGAYQNEWNGNQLSEGTYFYVIKLKDKTGATVVFKGWVLLLKD